MVPLTPGPWAAVCGATTGADGALPGRCDACLVVLLGDAADDGGTGAAAAAGPVEATSADRKSTRLNFSHTEIYTLSLHDALPIFARQVRRMLGRVARRRRGRRWHRGGRRGGPG